MPTEFWARTDSNSANNPALNLTGDPTVLISFVPSGTNGDVLLEYNAGAVDPDTQVLIDGVAYDFTFEFSGVLPTQSNQGAGQVPDQYEGSTVFLITIQDYPTAGESTRFSFLPEEEATQAEMEEFGNGAIRPQNIDTTTPGVICFASGTLIETPDGEKPVETLVVGDLVETVDDGALPIKWISSSQLHWPGAPIKALPILIAAKALGQGMPRRDLVVSPQHKVLVPFFQDNDAARDTLVPAKGLTPLEGVRVMRGKRTITYFHVMLAKHALVCSEGLFSESFYPGDTAMNMLRADQRNEIYTVFPDLRFETDSYGPAARASLSTTETQQLTEEFSERLACRA